MERSKTYFISDAHLGAGYIQDSRQHELKLVNWLKTIEPDCRQLFLVGDILDYWYEYKSVVPKGYVRFFGQLAHMTDIGIKITWFIGNHDIWIFDYLPTELGIEVIDGSAITRIEGKSFYISHGDGIGKLTTGFKFIRSFFRNKICQKLYSTIHPGITVPFAHKWSNHSRKHEYRDDAQIIDLKNITDWAINFSENNPHIDYIILGHYHVVEDKLLPTGCRLIILGDWIDKFSYAVFNGKSLELGNFG